MSAHKDKNQSVEQKKPVSSGIERRAYERAPIELKVEYRKLNTFFADYTRNISKGGLFIATSRPLPIGTKFLFKMAIPKIEEPLQLLGEVKWVGKEGENAGMGIEFLYDNDEQKEMVHALVRDLMVAS